jgi:putative flippase GtrA
VTVVGQGSRYVSTALLSAASDWATFELLLRLGGVEGVVAQSVSRLVGGLVAFALHKGWTYGARGLGTVGGEAARFLQLYVASYLLSLALLYVGHDVLGAREETAKVVADGACFALNFVVMRVWVFVPRD